MPDEISVPNNPAKTTKYGLILVGIVFILIFFITFLLRLDDKTKPVEFKNNYSDPEKNIEILDGWSCRNDSIGNTIFEGRIKNTSDSLSFSRVELRGTLYSNDDIVMNTNTGFMDSDFIGPGAESSFTVYVDNPKSQKMTCTISIEDVDF